MTGAQIVMLVLLIVTFAAIVFLAESRIALADEKISRILAEEHLATMTARAHAAEMLVRNASARIETRTGGPRGRTGFDRHADASLEQGNPS